MDTAHNATLPARKPRESNFELLRIVAMIFIVAHHFLIASGNINYYSPTLCGGEFANSFLVCGVDCFILISGYFGIKCNVYKFLKIVFLILLTVFIEYILARHKPLHKPALRRPPHSAPVQRHELVHTVIHRTYAPVSNSQQGSRTRFVQGVDRLDGSHDRSLSLLILFQHYTGGHNRIQSHSIHIPIYIREISEAYR